MCLAKYEPRADRVPMGCSTGDRRAPGGMVSGEGHAWRGAASGGCFACATCATSRLVVTCAACRLPDLAEKRLPAMTIALIVLASPLVRLHGALTSGVPMRMAAMTPAPAVSNSASGAMLAFVRPGPPQLPPIGLTPGVAAAPHWPGQPVTPSGGRATGGGSPGGRWPGEGSQGNAPDIRAPRSRADPPALVLGHFLAAGRRPTRPGDSPAPLAETCRLSRVMMVRKSASGGVRAVAPATAWCAKHEDRRTPNGMVSARRKVV